MPERADTKFEQSSVRFRLLAVYYPKIPGAHRVKYLKIRILIVSNFSSLIFFDFRIFKAHFNRYFKVYKFPRQPCFVYDLSLIHISVRSKLLTAIYFIYLLLLHLHSV